MPKFTFRPVRIYQHQEGRSVCTADRGREFECRVCFWYVGVKRTRCLIALQNCWYATTKFVDMPPQNLLVCHHKNCWYATTKCVDMPPQNVLVCHHKICNIKMIFHCFTVHFNSLNVTHQLMHFQYNNILV